MGRIKSPLPATRSRFFIFQTTLLAVSMVLSAANLSAQSDIKIRGQVTDSEAGIPIPGATVTIEELGRTASCDLAGRFEFGGLSDGRYMLRASRIGYRPSVAVAVEVKPDLPSMAQIALDPNPLRVADHIVLVPRDNSIHAERLGNITRLTVRPGEMRSVDDLIRAAPELELVGAGPQRMLRMRGSQANGVIIMLDGRMQNSSLSSTGDLAAIPLNAVSEIEIVSGSNHAAPGLAGSINFITEPITPDSRISSSAERGSFGHEQYEADLFKKWKSGVTGGVDFTSSFTRGRFEYDDPRGQTQHRENNYSRDRRVFGQAGFSRSAFSLKIKGRYFERHSGVPGPVFQYTPLATARNFEREVYIDAERTLGAQYSMGLFGGILSRTAAYNSPVTPTNFIPYDTRFSEQSRDLKITFDRAGAVNVNAIASLRREALDGVDFIRPQSNFGNHARDLATVGIGSEIKLSSIGRLARGNSVNLDIRAERSGARTFWGPSMAAHFRPSLPAGPAIDFAIFRSQRLPGLTDLYWKEDIFAAPNPELRRERSTGYEIGIEISLVRSWQTSARITRFATWYDDIIVWRRWGGDKFKPTNLSAALIDGWEASSSMRPFAGPIFIYWSGSFLRPQNREENTLYFGKYLTYRPIGSQRVSLDLKLGGWGASVFGRHIGRRYMTEENTKALPPVNIFDMTAEYSVRFKAFNAKASLEINNLGDRHYEILERIPEMPREIRARIEITRIWEEL